MFRLLCAVSAIIGVVGWFGPAAFGQSQQVYLERATLVGSGNRIVASNVPVAITPNLTIYVNLALQFGVDSNGNLSIAGGYPQISPMPTLLTGSFLPGKYVGPSPNKTTVTVAGPGVSDGGATQWTLVNIGANNCDGPLSASWYVGPVDNNPLAPRIKKAGITSTAWSYGIGTNSCSSPWRDSILIGATQSGNTITIVSFTSFGTDANSPQGQVTFTLTQ